MRKVRYFSSGSIFGETKPGDSVSVCISDKGSEGVVAGCKGERAVEAIEAGGEEIGRLLVAVVSIVVDDWWGMGENRSVILKLAYAKYTMRRRHTGMDFDL